jgi:hypothetical protein
LQLQVAVPLASEHVPLPEQLPKPDVAQVAEHEPFALLSWYPVAQPLQFVPA